MRPDLDEFEEMNHEGGEPRSKAISWLVLGVAVVGFGTLAYYAYQSGSQSLEDGQMLMVSAPEGPIKEAAVEPGGEEFPHKDKTIYDALSPYRTDEAKPAEKLLPEPEEPVIPEPAVQDTAPVTSENAVTAPTTFVNKDVTTKEATEVETVDEPMAASEEEASEVKAVVEETPAPVAKPLETAKAEPVAPKAEPVAPKVEPVAAEPVKAEPVKVEPKPEPKVEAPKPAATGSYKIQLGAFKSESEARATWNKIVAKHGDIVRGSPIIVKADLPNGTFYRLRATGYVSAEAAKVACSKLSSRGQACFYAGR